MSNNIKPATNPWKSKLIIAAIVAVLALVFVFQNTTRGRVHLFWWEISAPGWLWLLVLFGAGVIVGSLFPWFRRRATPQ